MIDKFKTGNPIWVYYNDIDSGANLTVPQLLRGFIGQEYQIEQKQFPNYRYVKTEGETKGASGLLGATNARTQVRSPQIPPIIAPSTGPNTIAAIMTVT